MTTTSRTAAITLDYTAVQNGNHTLNFSFGSFGGTSLPFPIVPPSAISTIV